MIPSVLGVLILVSGGADVLPASSVLGHGSGLPTVIVRHAHVVQQAEQDSSSLRGLARDAQSSFERRRIRRIPRTFGFGSAGCDERVGRICWIHGEGDWKLEPDSEPLRNARYDLIDVLERVGEAIPGDSWVMGQRVRYLAEAGRWEGALATTEGCRLVEQWWCHALRGFVLHGFDRFAEAEIAFDLALAEMESDRREDWEDLDLLADGRARDRLNDAAREGPDQEARLRRFFWALSDPLFLREGNDRRSEHFSRWVMAHIQERARTPWDFPWSGDLEELTIRYGWERGWERNDPPAGNLAARASVIGHMLPHGRQFTPPGEVIERFFEPEPREWDLEEEAPSNAYTPTFADHVLPGMGQLAMLRRGDSIVLLGATLLPEAPQGHDPAATESEEDAPIGDVAWAPPERAVPAPEMGLILLDREGTVRREARIEGQSRGSVVLAAPAGSYLVSLESWDPGLGRAGRIRLGLRADTVPEGVATVSDLILLDRAAEAPVTVPDLVRSMRPHTDLAHNDTIRVAWELGGIGSEGGEVTFELSLLRESGGFFSRVGGWFGGSDDDEPLQLSWSEFIDPGLGPRLRSVNVDLPELDGGDYVLRLGIVLVGREELVINRAVRIVN